MTPATFATGELQRQLDKLGLSQLQLAFEAGLTPSTIYRACRGDELRRNTYVRIKRVIALHMGGDGRTKSMADGHPAGPPQLEAE